MPFTVSSLPADKPKIVFHAAMMAIQNFGFFTMYYDLAGSTPGPLPAGGAVPVPKDSTNAEDLMQDPCKTTRDAALFMALTCFCVAFLCVGMGFGGYTDDSKVFWLYWLLHLVGGACYTVCTITVPLARYGDDGVVCADLDSKNGQRVEAVYLLHAALYLVYVGGMLSITYFSFLKPTFFGGKKGAKVRDAGDAA